jgi:hypothetical protein
MVLKKRRKGSLEEIPDHSGDFLFSQGEKITMPVSSRSYEQVSMPIS